MDTREFEVFGIQPEPVVHRNINPSGQSNLLEHPQRVVIVRPLDPSDYIKEARQRQLSIRLHQQYLHELVLESHLAILQGKTNDTPPISIPVLGRMTEKYTDVIPIGEIPILQLAIDENISNQIAEINLGYLKMLLRENVVPDYGRSYNSRLSHLPQIAQRWLGSLTCSNIFIGKSKEGVTRCFPDPDWVNQLPENKMDVLKKKLRFMGVVTARYLFFKISAAVSSINALLAKTRDLSSFEQATKS